MACARLHFRSAGLPSDEATGSGDWSLHHASLGSPRCSSGAQGPRRELLIGESSSFVFFKVQRAEGEDFIKFFHSLSFLSTFVQGETNTVIHAIDSPFGLRLRWVCAASKFSK